MNKRAPRPHILLLTGVTGIGKTTVIHEVADHLPPSSMVGFYTEEIRESGRRTGFRLITFEGKEGVMAHINFNHRDQVGKYGVDVTTIDRLVESTLRLEPPGRIYLVDEIGKMECLSQQFITAMRALLASGNIVVETVARKGGGFIQETKARNDVQLWEVTRSNRNSLPEQVLAWLQQGTPVTK